MRVAQKDSANAYSTHYCEYVMHLSDLNAAKPKLKVVYIYTSYIHISYLLHYYVR